MSTLPTSTDLHAEFRAGWHRLEIVAQPIHLCRDAERVATEALLRWRRNEDELWAAATVLPLAEDSGRIEEFTAWATERALTVWSTSTRRTEGGRVALNLHECQLARPSLAAELAMIARSLDVALTELILEIPDRLGPTGCRDAVAGLRPAVEAGVRLAIDNHRGPLSPTDPAPEWLPIGSLVKLDPDLVFAADDPAARERLRRIVDGLHDQGYVTVAEGVERREQLEGLVACGVPLAQGYVFGRPEPLI